MVGEGANLSLLSVLWTPIVCTGYKSLIVGTQVWKLESGGLSCCLNRRWHYTISKRKRSWDLTYYKQLLNSYIWKVLDGFLFFHISSLNRERQRSLKTSFHFVYKTKTTFKRNLLLSMPTTQKTSFPKISPRFLFFYLSSKFLKQDRTSVAAFKEWGLRGRKPGVPLASCWAWCWGQGGARRQKSSRASAWEGGKPGTARACRLSAADSSLVELHSAFLQKQLLGFGREVVVFGPPTHERRREGVTIAWTTKMLHPESKRGRHGLFDSILLVVDVHVYPPPVKLLRSLILEAAQPLWLYVTNYVGSLEAFYKGR